jgi:16S rRNA processing protein RimM
MGNNFIKIGSLQKSFGTEGFIKFKSFPEFKDEILSADFLWLAEDDYHVPYRVVSLNKAKNMIQFDDVFSNEQASKIHNKAIYIKTDDSIDSSAEDEDFIVGYKLYDNEEFIAEIVEVKEIAGYLYGVINYQSKEILIPIHENLVLEMDPEQSILRMDLPEGILEL